MERQKTGLSISDLHLGQAGSVGHRHLKQLTDYVQKHQPDEIFLNGDIVEVHDLKGCRQTIIKQMNDSLTKLDGFIESAIAANPHVKLHYIFGNHDNFNEMVVKLEERVERFAPHFDYHESHYKTQNTVHLHGDLQTDYPYKSKREMLKAAFSGNIETKMGAMRRDDVARLTSDFPNEISIKDSRWKNIVSKQGFGARVGSHITHVKNMFDTTISSRTMPLNKVTEAIYNTIATQQPELLDGVENIVLGHYHPAGAPVLEHENVRFIFTGPSTLFSQGPAYHFKIDEQGKCRDFQSLALGRGYQVSSSNGYSR